jgi:asparagine synthase (glutamine-hydrolysing)
MVSHDGRYVLVYNGEVYNHNALRDELQTRTGGGGWRGHSDTETLLEAIAHWGLKPTLERANGMFALAVWDRKKEVLSIARDRMGIKPLYYGHTGDSFLFASELRAIHAWPNARLTVDRDVLATYLRYGYVPSPYSIYEDIWKCPPGSLARINENAEIVEEPISYWQLDSVIDNGTTERRQWDEEELLDRFESLMLEAVGTRMEADVPLGALLSGGFDSSLIVALMQKQSDRPVKTFSVGFADSEYNEAPHARAVANHLGTDHTERFVSAEDAREVIPQLPQLCDEPFGDSSQIPTYLISKMVRKDATVALSGDGGDELFAGYNRHFKTRKYWDWLSRFPRVLRQAAGHAASAVPTGLLTSAAEMLHPNLREMSEADLRVERFVRMMKARDADEVYKRLVTWWPSPEKAVPGSSERSTIVESVDPQQGPGDFTERMMYLDQAKDLPGDMLVKVDRASMATGLEVRVPLLDHRVVEFSWHVPLRYKIRNGSGKYLLKQLVRRHIPGSLMDRPKKGFSVPIKKWLRGSLKDWADDLLDPRQLERDGFFDPEVVRRYFREHVEGRRSHQHALWTLLMFQMWYDEYR